jgi:hypothetical protein
VRARLSSRAILGHHQSVRTAGELQALGASLEDLLARVTALVEQSEAETSRDDALELVAIERGLSSTLRRIRRLVARIDA